MEQAAATGGTEMRREAEEGLETAILYKAICDNNWLAAKVFIDAHPGCLNAELSAKTGETALHVAAKFGRVGIVEELVRLVPSEYLEMPDARGHTPLITAAMHSGLIPTAACLIQKNSNVLAIGNPWLPVASAFRNGHSQMGRYLYSLTPLRVLKPENGLPGPTLLTQCFFSGNLDIALDLLRRCPELLFAPDAKPMAAIVRIVFFLPQSSLNTSQLGFWKRWLYHYTKTPSTTTTEHSFVDMKNESESNKAQGLNLLQFLTSHICNFSGMKEIYKMKLQHAQAAEILNLVCENLKFLDLNKKNKIAEAINVAAREGKAEFLLRVVKSNPELISLVTFPHPEGHIFFTAISYRQAEIFNLIRGFRFRNAASSLIFPNSNTLFHVAAMLAPASQLNRISGAALQMQRELQWFKEVESVMDPGNRLFQNNEGLTPVEYFKINHKELRNEGEKWMKDTASSCSVVGALIVTIMFAAAFTVPGGNDQNSGYPMFLKEKLFKVFLILDALSLFASTTSVLTFLGILTSRYTEEDFLYSLPTKLIIGLSTLFLSIATMMMAFSTTIIIMLQHQSSRAGAFLPVIMLASVPVTLFVLLQFPLLVEIISSTYGRGNFNKKVEKWP
ncbi:uncharacterized protein LOC129322934 [Prosopis cineraria]|uniref:uncharacterized protein LOC129322934 n=1 Tax=Prosopis cineraria TaxID=364024 RepID=UPI00240ECC78|nr:uncharacterized protein LOC129322934 [Prosopis cineraria]